MEEILTPHLINAGLFLVICIIMSLVVGSIWFHPRVFGTLYARWMGLPIPKPGAKMPKGMAGTFIAEILSRILYFGVMSPFLMNLGNISGLEDSLIVILYILTVHTGFVFSTQLSLISWTKAQKKSVILISGNTLLQTIFATLIWIWFFA